MSRELYDLKKKAVSLTVVCRRAAKESSLEVVNKLYKDLEVFSKNNIYLSLATVAREKAAFFYLIYLQ